MIRSMMRMTWSSFWKTTFVNSSLPDVDLARAVDHDFRDGVITEERLQRPEADDLVGDLLEHPDALGAGEGQALLVDDAAEDLLDLPADLHLVGQVQLGIEVLDDAVLDPELDVTERLARRALRGQARCRGRGRATAAALGLDVASGLAGRDRQPLLARTGRTGTLDSLQQ